MRTLRLALGI